MPTECVARLLALAAGFGTDPAMLHVGVSLALFGTDSAGGRACLESDGEHLRLERRLAGDDAPGRVAEVGAIEVEPDAPVQSFWIRLAEAGVGAGRTRLSAVETGANTGGQCVTGEGRLRVRAFSLSFSRSRTSFMM